MPKFDIDGGDDQDQESYFIPPTGAPVQSGTPIQVNSADEPRITQVNEPTADPSSNALKELLGKMQRKRQVFQEFTLPSRGVFNPELPQGRIFVRSMGGNEERILLTPSLMKSGEALNSIFGGCTQNVNPLRLTGPDRLWLMYIIRSLTYGTLYEFDVKCPACAQPTKHSYDLDELAVNEAPETITDPMTTDLPVSGLKVTYAVERGEHEIELMRRTRQKKANFFNQANAPSDLFDQRALLLIESFTDTETNSTFKEPSATRQIWATLEAGDRSHFRNVINDLPWGINTNINLGCPLCQEEFDLPLPTGIDFFYPRKVQKKK